MFPPWSSLTRVCGMACALDHAGKEQQTKKQKILSERKREFLKNDLRHQKKRAQTACNKYVRMRDEGMPCISCGNTNQSIKYDAGHFIPAGRSAALRFEETNIHRQCSNHCNVHLSGNYQNYRQAMIGKYGEQHVAWLEGPHEHPRWRAADYRRIADEYRDKLKALKAREIQQTDL